jgi:hypothetical protein
LESDPSVVLPQWQDSVVALWTPRAHASGFLIDAKGLIATNQRVIGTATSVEVQLSPQVKVPATVLVADAMRDVAVLWIDAAAAASLRPLPLGCGLAARPAVVDGQTLFTISAPLREAKGMLPGTVSRVEPRALTADFMLASGSAGGPVFTADGGLVGITSVVEGDDRRTRESSRVVRIDAACELLESAEKKMSAMTVPNGTHLPVEPLRPFPVDVLKEAAQRRFGSLSPYQLSTSDFEVAFITPVLAYGARYPPEAARTPQGSGRTPEAQPAVVRPLMDFAEWSEYVVDFPPVLLVRVTPKLVEGFLTTVARGAARTQGVSLPPIKHAKTAFSRMRAFCGDTEVAPIHRFALEQRVTPNDAILEGLYVFDPGALGPHCGAVKLELFSEKEPVKGDTRVVDPKMVQQIWDDFAPYRQL